MYTIDSFWIPRLGTADVPIAMEDAPVGWTTGQERLPAFVEAPLRPAEEFGELTSRGILLVSAPGAVGKSTLAREIAARTGAVLLDLAKAEAVGAATVSGGLAWAGLFDSFRRGEVALLIDGLDEARIRVTQESFVAFLQDVRKLVDSNRKPITLFGRTSAIEDAWLHFTEMGIQPPVLEIQFYRRDTALSFVTRQVTGFREEQKENVLASASADRRAAALILDRFGTQTESDDGGRFVGYAPVLIAVSKRIAAERNPMALVQTLESGADAVSLNSIVDAILEREQSKLNPLEFSDPLLKNVLYGKGEQVDRLISEVYRLGHAPALPEMSQKDAETYKNALDGWVPDHPFTDGSGKRPSSEVFGGFLVAEALKREWASASVREKELRSAKVNPFIWRFRLPDQWLGVGDGGDLGEAEAAVEPDWVPMADLGLILASLQAQLPISELAHLFIDAEADPESEQREIADVEIEWHFDGGGRLLRLSANCDGTIYFGSRVSDVDISGNELEVVMLGTDKATDVTFAAPVEIDVHRIDAGASGIVVEGPPRYRDVRVARVVRLRCSRFDWQSDALSVRPEAELAVDWPGSGLFPWHSFRKPETPDVIDFDLEERLQKLRRILVLFRARGKGQLAKFKGAIDAVRRTRGSGAAVRDLLLEEGILSAEGRVYVLNTDRLSEVLGLSFQDIQSRTLNEKTIEFLKRVGQNS